MIDKCPDDSTRNFFKTKQVVQAVRQPNNILRQLTSAKFDSRKTDVKPAGTFKCNDKKCKICALYLQECNKVMGHNGLEWEIPSYITCNSRMVIYFLTCLGCDVYSKVGKTNCLHVLMEVDNYDKLLVYEEYFHKQGFDVCNRWKAAMPV